MSTSHSNPPATPIAPLQSATQRIGARHRRRTVFSIRWIVTASAILLIAVAVLSVNGVAERNTRKALEREVEGRLMLETRNLALTSTNALLDDFPELTLHPYLKRLKKESPEVAFALVLDRDGVIQGDPDARQLGSKYIPGSTLAPVEAHQTLARGELLSGDRTILVAAVPVTHRNGQNLGTALVAIERSYLEDLLSAARRQQTLVMVVFLIVGILAAYMMMSTLLRPIMTLRQGIERIGSGDLDTPLVLKDRTEFGLLADAVNDMAAELKHAQAEMVERERLAHEVDLARQIQRSLLPSRKLLSGSFVIEGSQRAATEVGGDYYDFFQLPGNRIGITVADVSGKGLAGCLVMSMLHALLRALRNSHTKPSELLIALDEQLSETLQSGMFVTMFYGMLDPSTGVLTYASAGHCPSMVFRAATGTIEQFGSRGIPLGAIRGGAIRKTLSDETITLAQNDALVQYTDGINEAFNPSGTEQFGLNRMEGVVQFAAKSGSTRIIESLHRSVKDWAGDQPPLDDETVLVVSRESSVAEAATATEELDPLACLAEAKMIGRRLRLPAQLQDLVSISEWLKECSFEPALSDIEFELVRSALYEASANVVEHGYQGQTGKEVELWWVPGPKTASGNNPMRFQARNQAADPNDVLRSGYFLILDHGKPFSADNWQGSDFQDPQVRLRGRGIGLDIIHRAMSHVAYYPGTPMGNLTLMAFIPDDEQKERRVA